MSVRYQPSSQHASGIGDSNRVKPAYPITGMSIRGMIAGLIGRVTTVLSRDEGDIRIYRQGGGAGAIIFVHGLKGEMGATWGRFPELLLAEPGLRGWDIYGYGYPTSLRLDIPRIWASDPDLETVASALRTRLLHDPFKQYKSIALLAHSMGGLVVQRAVLTKEIMDKTAHVVLFGCPSSGVDKARIARKSKRQIADMAPGSEFIVGLRKTWMERFGSNPPFDFYTVAGRMDQFVDTESSLGPFPENSRRIVAGDHLQIVKPATMHDVSVRIVVEAVQGRAAPRGRWDSAVVAGEAREFRRVIEQLSPHVAELDEQAMIELALAYDGIGQGEKAIHFLEDRCAHGANFSDPFGVLGGRLKRRWLLQRKEADWGKAHDAYSKGLARSLDSEGKPTSPNQAMYHAINLAFLEMMHVPAVEAKIPKSALDHANQALEYALSASQDQWMHATKAEAQLYLGNIEIAAFEYRAAVRLAKQREIDSMYNQALVVGDRVGGGNYLKSIMEAFGQGPADEEK